MTFIWNGGSVVTRPNNTLAISGQYISGTTALVPGSLLAPDSVAHFIPVIPGRNITIDQLAVNVEVAGSAGSFCRLGIYDDDGDEPDDLIVDAGIVATDTVGLKTISISESLVGGDRYWFCGVQQGGASISATYTSFTLSSGTITVTNPSSGFNGILKLGVSGALPDPAAIPLGLLGSQVMLRVMGRVM